MNEKDILIPDGYSLVKAGQKIPKGSLYSIFHSGSRDLSQWRKNNVTINWTRLEHWLPSIKKNMNKKRLNTIVHCNKTYTAPVGYVFLNMGDKIKKGDFVFSVIKANNPIENLKYSKAAYESPSSVQSEWMCPSIRKIRVRKVGPAIPKGYRIIKIGEIIPEGYYYRNSKVGSKNLNDWIENNSNTCAGQKLMTSNALWIAPILPVPVIKKYHLELNESEYLALESILKKMKIVG